MDLNLDRARFYTKLFLGKGLGNNVSFDKAFSEIVRKYSIEPREASLLYKLLYKVVMYYHSIRFLVSYKGQTPKLSNIVEYLYSKGFDIEDIFDEIEILSSSFSEIFKLALKHGYPPWLVRDIYGKLPPLEINSLLRSLNERKRWLRVNKAKASLEDAISCLEKTGVSVVRHSVFKDILQLNDPFLKIGSNKCVTQGIVIPQDISSYISTFLMKTITRNLIDMCTAPGLKLHQALLTKNIDKAIGIDISEARLISTQKLLNIYGGDLYKVILINSDSRRIVFNVENTIVLVDAPCSNTGAIYTDPFIKIRISRKQIKKLSIIQKNILKNSFKNRGLVYYMTCSIHPLEGEEVVNYIIRRYDKRIALDKLDKTPFLSHGYIGYDFSTNVYRLHPHMVNGQGFFIALFKVD
ncbi:MAG: RsmB/NOP family class I SAM-dependent RNA methyltransferase [Desulfurococcaceae archaeon]